MGAMYENVAGVGRESLAVSKRARWSLNPMTDESWSEDTSPSALIQNTGCIRPDPDHPELLNAGQSRGRFVVSTSGRRAYQKRGSGGRDYLEPFREYTASILGRWLGVHIPEVLLDFDMVPIALVIVVPSYVSISHIETHEPCKQGIRDDAISGPLDDFAGVSVLNAWVGVADRPARHSNYLYVVEQKVWYSIDYSDSYNDKSLEPDEPAFVDAVRRARNSIVEETLERASAIPLEDIERLVNVPDDRFVCNEQRRKTFDFLRKRQMELREIIASWLRER